jgi:predicted ATPase
MHSEVQKIRDKLVSSPWPKYLKSLTISGLHNWDNEEVRFDFPVCVIAGENGSGKSTVLKAAACAYAPPGGGDRAYFPADFFPVTAWDHVSGATLTYALHQGVDDLQIRYRKLTGRWRVTGRRPRRTVVFQDISRTLPLEATVGYAKIAKTRALEISSRNLNADTIRYYSAIMGREYSEARLALTAADSSRVVGVVTASGTEYSQFHQGAGEDTVFDLLALLQDVPNTSFVLIDEIEASLHPHAQRRLMHYLLWLARRKKLQVVVTTHSSFIIDEVPPEARVFLSRSRGGVKTLYGVSSNYAVSRMDPHEPGHPDVYIFVEDDRAKILGQEILRRGGIDLRCVDLRVVGPDSSVRLVGRLAVEGSLPTPGFGLVDPDAAASEGCLSLPGTMPPERQLLTEIASSPDGLTELAGRAGKDSDRLADDIESAMTEPDHHLWVSILASAVGCTEDYLWTAIVLTWLNQFAGHHGDELAAISEMARSHASAA